MIFFRLLWITLSILLLVGLGTAVLMALETLSPGLPEDATTAKVRYSWATMLHGTTMALSLPIASIGGLTSILLAERHKGRAAYWIFNACGSLILVLAIAALFFNGALQNYVGDVRNRLIVLLCALLVGLLLIRHQDRNGSAFIFFGACGVPLLLYTAQEMIFGAEASRSYWMDTHVATAGLHLIGSIFILLFLSCLSVWAHARGAKLNGWISAACAIVLIVLARLHTGAHLAAGLSGMPRRYADYPQSFAEPMASASWLGFAYAAVIVLTLSRFFVAVWRRDRSTAADEF